MKNILLIIAALIVLPLASNAQKWEVGLFGGGSNYMGELSDASIVLSETHPAVGGLVRYYVNPFLTLRFAMTYGVISGTDENATTPAKRLRNLSFRSDIFEVAFIPEFNIIGFRDNHLFSPYIFAGIAGYHFNPTALYKGEWIDLQPLGTEGQGTLVYPSRKPYSLYHFSIPFGGGVKIGFNNGLNIGLELGARKTFTDYLDDVSTTYVDQNVLLFENGALAAALSNRSGELGIPIEFADGEARGSAATQDWYLFGGLTITYTLGEGGGGMRSKRAGCPIY